MSGQEIKTTVVNVYIEPCDVCIMCPSIFQNPFRINRDRTREEVIEKFNVYFEARMYNDIYFHRAVEVLRGLRLGCCCKPKPCHGDIIAAWLNGDFYKENEE